MKINKNSKVELCKASPDRCSIEHPYLDATDRENPVVVSTNGRMLVRVPVEIEEGDVSGPITESALKAARKLGNKRDEAHIHANGSLALDDGSSLPRPVLGEGVNFPNWKQVIPEEGTKVIAFNAQFLLDIAKAISGNGETVVTIRFQDELSLIRVTTSSNPGALGVLMPVRMS
jgi:hypothetical protein